MVQNLSGLQRRLREKNFSSLIEVMDPGNSRKVVRHFLAMRVDAVIFIGHFDEAQLAERLEELNANETPHLVIDHFGIKEANTISLNRALGLKQVVDMLLEQGHRTFGLLAFSGQVRGTLDRVRGVREALTARGLDFKRCVSSLDHLFVRENDFEYGRQIAKRFIRSKELPTAVIGLNDAIAIGAMHGLQEEGVSVPSEVSVVGFNNQDICLMTTPSLTSVDQRVEDTVNVAAEFVLSQLGQPWTRGRPTVRLIDPLLIVRNSSGPVRR
jgi:DNA-binding LacI/PurR family transcriptional regulator